ncbi:MAG TPA: TolC family protein [Polyangiales bacterium]
MSSTLVFVGVTGLLLTAATSLWAQTAQAPASKAAAPVAAVSAGVAPTAASPVAATAAPDAAVQTAQAPVEAPPPDQFDLASALRGPGPSMTNDQVAQRAVQTAPSIAKVEAAGEKARMAADQVYLAVYPRVDITARYTRLSEATPLPVPFDFSGAIPLNWTKLGADGYLNPAASGKPFKFPDVIKDQFMLQGTVAYPVSQLFFSILPRYRAAQQAAEVQKYQAEAEAQTIALRAREAFWNYARGRASLSVARAALEQARAHRRDVEALVSAGTLARVELMRADAQIAAASVAVARTQAGVAVARSALYSITHLEGSDDITIGEDVEHPLPELTQTPDALLALALERRSEIKALRTLANVHQQSLDAQQGDKLPRFAVGGSATLADPNQRYSMYVHSVRTDWAAYAQLSWSPNDLLTANKAEGQTRADLAQTLADLQALEDGLKIEVTQAYQDYGASREAMQLSQAGIAAAEESYRVRREQFRAGAAVATDVIDAESELRRARLDLANASIDMHVAQARLDRVTEAK